MNLEFPAPASLIPEVLALTPRWLVLNKPAGWLTIPGRPSAEEARGKEIAPPVLLDWARNLYPEILTVHRLDRETSGVVLFARTEADHRQANLWFQDHLIKKNYDCLAKGQAGAPVFRVKQPIAGSSSATQVEVRESFAEGFLARVTPVTGRRHQIRIHLAGEGHPIWGDVTYQGPRQVVLAGKPLRIGRVALHAATLQLPMDGKRELFEAPWPADFLEWVEAIRVRGTRV